MCVNPMSLYEDIITYNTVWHQLDANVRNVKAINIFKYTIKNMFISLYD